MSRISALSIGAVDPKALTDFWCAALGWRVLFEDATGAAIGPPDGAWPVIEIGRVTEPWTGRSRLHLDLRADGVDQSAEVARLLALGASHADVGQGPDASWVVLADPEGNEFCVLARSVQDVPPDPQDWYASS